MKNLLRLEDGGEEKGTQSTLTAQEASDCFWNSSSQLIKAILVNKHFWDCGN